LQGAHLKLGGERLTVARCPFEGERQSLGTAWRRCIASSLPEHSHPATFNAQHPVRL